MLTTEQLNQANYLLIKAMKILSKVNEVEPQKKRETAKQRQARIQAKIEAHLSKHR